MTEGGPWVVDASVVVKWYVPEIDSERAGLLLQQPAPLLAPELLLAELGNVLWKKVRRGELRVAEGEEILGEFLSAAPVDIRSDAPLVETAYGFATAVGCTVYDALYLSLAVAEQVRFVTADDRVVRSVRGTELESFAVPLAVW